MGEIWRKPNELEKEKLLKAYGDNIIFALVRGAIEVLNSKEIDMNFLREDFDNWSTITRRLINRGKYALLAVELERVMEGVADEQWRDFKPHKYQPPKFTKKNYKNLLSGKIKITDIAREYGLEVKGKKALCPFHKDTNPSLSFSDKKGVFNCFGCGTKGDILKFIQLIEEVGKLRCPKCKRKLVENHYHLAIDKGYDFFCSNCMKHYSSKYKKLSSDEEW